MYTHTTQKQVRAAFWRAFPMLAVRYARLRANGCTQNQYPADVRCSFVDYVDNLQRDGQISESLAERVTL
jgi:hypothetical protein